MKNKTHIPPLRFRFLTFAYDFVCSFIGLGKEFKQKIIEKTDISSNKKVIDIGCGTGVLTLEIKRKFRNAQVTGIDPDKDALSIAIKKAKKERLEIDFFLTGAEKLPFKNNSFDFAISSLAFHHMPLEIKKAAVKETFRILKSKGKFYIFDFKPRKMTFLNFWTFWEMEYARDNYEGKIRVLLTDAGFQDITKIMTTHCVLELIEARK